MCAMKVVLLLAICHISMVYGAANNFHLSFEGDATNSRILDWQTDVTVASSVVYYGFNIQQLDRVAEGHYTGSVGIGNAGHVKCWFSRLEGLEVGQRVYYSLTMNDRQPMSFVMEDPRGMTLAIFGDLGASQLGMASGVSLMALKADLESKSISGVLHLGDVSYELIDRNGEQFMQDIKPLSARVPYMTTVGNHEYQYAVQLALQNYDTRFAGIQYGAGSSSKSGSSRFYSFDLGFIHYAIIDTEVYGDEAYFVKSSDGQWIVDNEARKGFAKYQRDWLEHDFQQVDRSKTPYLVVGGHRPPFQTPTGLLDRNNGFYRDIVPLMHAFQVDLYICGHAHAYYSIAPSRIGNFNVPHILIVGSAGNNEFIRERSSINTNSFHVLTNSQHYGYGHLSATEKKLIWSWGRTASDGGSHPKPTVWTIQDSFEIPRREFTLLPSVRPPRTNSSRPSFLSTPPRVPFVPAKARVPFSPDPPTQEVLPKGYVASTSGRFSVGTTIVITFIWCIRMLKAF